MQCCFFTSIQLKSDLSGVRIGVVKEGFDGCKEDVADVVRNAARSLEKAGATVTDVSVPLHTYGKDGCDLFFIISD